MTVRQSIVALWLIVLAFVVFSITVQANPTAPDTLTRGDTNTMDINNYAPKSTTASAGNLTAMVLYGISQTRSWQGFWGNVTGTITLDDPNNFTFYNWTSATPNGQVYATLNQTISWDDVTCLDFDGVDMNIIKMHAFYNISPIDADRINVTFNQTDHVPFEVGSHTMTGCPTTYIHQDDLYQQANFQNVLLYDTTNTDHGWIYATTIEDKTWGSDERFTCFNGEVCDFQILVNENGHGSDIDDTTYYFWVELT